MGQLLISPILDLAECNIYGVDVVESFSGPKKGVEWLRFFASTRVLIFTFRYKKVFSFSEKYFDTKFP